MVVLRSEQTMIQIAGELKGICPNIRSSVNISDRVTYVRES